MNAPGVRADPAPATVSPRDAGRNLTTIGQLAGHPCGEAELDAGVLASSCGSAHLMVALPFPVLTIDTSGAATTVNRAWSELTRLTPERSLGTGWLAAVDPRDTDALLPPSLTAVLTTRGRA